MHWLVLKTRHKAKQQKDRSNSSQFNLIAHLISWHFGTTIRLFIPTVPASLEHWRRLCKVIPQSQSKVGGFSVSWQGLMHSNQRTDKFSRITNFHFSFFFFFFFTHYIKYTILFFFSSLETDIHPEVYILHALSDCESVIVSLFFPGQKAPIISFV